MYGLRNACTEIWKGYKLYAESAKVSRRGYELTGITDEPANSGYADAFIRRGESALEHQAKTAWLTSAFIAVHGINLFDVHWADSSVWSLITVALCHDIGEIDGGDIPDDGNPQHGTKDAREISVFKAMAHTYSPLEFRDRAVWDFQHFQTKDTVNGQALYALDKLEAVLTLILLEDHGIIGSIKSKPTPTNQDLYFMEMTGSDNPVDCWGAHMRTQIQDFPAFITEPVLTLLDVAINDVRGHSFSWWYKHIPPYSAH